MTHEGYKNQHIACEKYIFLLQFKSNVFRFYLSCSHQKCGWKTDHEDILTETMAYA